MNTRSRTEANHTNTPSLDFGSTAFDLDALSDEELETLLFDDDSKASGGFWNLPTLAGLSLVSVGMVYLLQQMGLFTGFDLEEVMALLPILGGILIILLGMGVLSWSSKSRKDTRKAPTADTPAARGEKQATSSKRKWKHRLTRSQHERKIFGVCGGIAERLDVDPTLVRIAFVIGTIFSGGPPFVVAYLALAYVMPESKDTARTEGHVTIVRDG